MSRNMTTELEVGRFNLKRIELVTDDGAENLSYLAIEDGSTKDLIFNHEGQKLEVIGLALQGFQEDSGSVSTHLEETHVTEMLFPLSGEILAVLEKSIGSGEFQEISIKGNLTNEQVFDAEYKLIETDEGIQLEISIDENPFRVKPTILPPELKHGSAKQPGSDGWMFAVKFQAKTKNT